MDIITSIIEIQDDFKAEIETESIVKVEKIDKDGMDEGVKVHVDIKPNLEIVVKYDKDGIHERMRHELEVIEDVDIKPKLKIRDKKFQTRYFKI